ncbi:MAG TPA: hypothetical protein VEQ60_12815 [Longimicrobium sp.]|nr:hypothetical protein [Longimicrobium sp.]
MRTAPSAPRATRTLLLALALCACGRGNDAADRPPAETTASATQAAGPAPCTPPPVVDPERFKGSWDALSKFLVDSLRVSFRNDATPDSSTALVKMCRNCELVSLTIIPTTTTFCTPPDSLHAGQARLMGLVVLRSAFTPSDTSKWRDPIPANDSIFMFAGSTDGPATMVYKKDEQAVVAPDSSWLFFYCPDGHSGNRPEAKWRSRGKNGQGSNEDGNNYGWMTCASGCCQFYTPPPNSLIATPAQASPNAPDAVGRGRNQGAAPGQRPTWCP